MMNYFIMATQFGIFIFKRVKTMRACGYNLFYPIAIQDPDILISHHLKQELVSCSSHRVSCTHFFIAKYGKVDSYLLQNCCKGFGDFLSALVKAPRAAHPK